MAAQRTTRTRLTQRGKVVLGLLGFVLLVLLGSGFGSLTGGGDEGLAKAGDGWRLTRVELVVLDRLDGEATYYGPGMEGGVTANGEPFDTGALTAAHPDVAFDSMVRVVRPDGRAVVVRVNDRLPDAGPERIDLTPASFRRIGALDEGRIPVVIELVEPRIVLGSGPAGP